jgi:CBS-domain-containing membrane protein
VNATMTQQSPGTMVLRAETAEDLMSPNPVSIRASASLREALALLTDKGISAAPVVDDAGRPMGVLSRTDLLVHQREAVPHPGPQSEEVDPTLVRDVMTPAVFSVAPVTSAASVVQQMLGLKVHHLFVVDEAGTLVGAISAFDVLRNLEA